MKEYKAKPGVGLLETGSHWGEQFCADSSQPGLLMFSKINMRPRGMVQVVEIRSRMTVMRGLKNLALWFAAFSLLIFNFACGGGESGPDPRVNAPTETVWLPRPSAKR
jgi:hypothetical protein